MSQRKEILDETKKQISSLLVSLGAARGQPGIPTRQFHNDYRAIIGNSIPFRELGYSCLDDFFRDIPETVFLNYEGGQALVKLVENEQISHIVKLVDNQKTTVSKKRAKTRKPFNDSRWESYPKRYGGYQGHRQSGPNLAPRMARMGGYRPTPPHPIPPLLRQVPRGMSLTANHGGSRWAAATDSDKVPQVTSSSNVPTPTMKSPSATVPPMTRGMIKDLLLSFPNGICGGDIATAFSKRFGHCLNPQQMGFSNLYTLFTSVIDIVDVEEMEHDFRICQKKLKPVHLRGNRSGDSLPAQKRKRSEKDYLLEQGEQGDQGKPGPNLLHDIKEVLHKFQHGVRASQFPKIFEEHMGVRFPWKDLGFPSVIELMGEISNDIHIVRASPSDWKLYSLENAKNAPPTPKDVLKEKKIIESVIDAQLRQSVRQVLACYPEGLPMFELPETFKSMVGKILPVEELGFPDLTAFVQRLSTEGVLDMKQQGKDLVLLKMTPEEGSTSTSFLLKRPGLGKPRKKFPKPWKKTATPVQHVPADAVGQGVRYTELPRPETNPDEFDVEVLVSMVNSPGEFWLQLKGIATTEALEDLMDDLELVYDGRESKDYRVPEYMVTIDQVCVAKYPNDNNWHRVTITSVSLDFVEVYFVDYGTVCSVHKNTLRLLKSQFLHLPAQALPARLASLVPLGNTDIWLPRATQRMLELTANHVVSCMIRSIDENKVLSVYLCDTTGEQDIHIQDVLIEEGLAQMATLSMDPEDVLEAEPAEDEQLPSTSSIDNVAYVSPMKRSMEDWNRSEASGDPIPVHIKFVELTPNFSIHLVKCDDKAYVLSGEISSFYWEKDLLRSMLRQRRVDVPRKVLPEAEYSELFSEFEINGIGGIHDNTGQRKSHITMYTLESVLLILDAFGDTDPELRQAIEREIRSFDPNDPYWRGETEDDDEMRSCSDITGDDDSSVYDMQDLAQAIEVLQMRRKKLVNDMVSVQTMQQTKDNVEKLQEIERDIARIRQRIEKNEKRGRDASLGTEEEFIQKCVGEQYSKPKKPPPGVLESKPQTPPLEVVPPLEIVSRPVEDTVATSVPSSARMAPTVPVASNQPNLSAEQQQFLMQYNLLLSHQLLQSQAMMGATHPGVASFPNFPGMVPGMPSYNPMYNLQDSMAGLSMTDMSPMLTGQGRGASQQFQPNQKPGNYFQGPQNM